MTELKLISRRNRTFKPLVEAALQNELRLLQAGIRRCHQRLQQFEKEFGISTAKFLRKYEKDELNESLEFAEWIGEHRLLERLQEKAETLQEIRFAN